MIKHYHQVDTNPEELLADNIYNEIGQLINKKTGNISGTPLQSIHYAYNIRGWQTKVNDPSNLGSKLFAYELKYNSPEYTNKSAGRFNGNISEVDWKASDDNKLRRYNYNHDALERLKSGIYSEPNSTIPQNDYYNETLEYDINGNILSLQRNRFIENMPAAQVMDNLSYNYTANKLNSVSDNSANYGGYPGTSGNLFTYDDNGNMKSHVDRGILQIDYNHLNLPSYLKFDKEYYSHDSWDIAYNENTKYMYRADGVKLKKIHTYGSGRTSIETTRKTEYFDGFQYEEDILQFVPTSEGYYDFVQNKYIYQYKDQVGNIRLAYYKGSSGTAQIDRTTNYYPFGLEFGGELNIGYSISPNYAYSTQGQERQRDTGWSSFKWRNYDPAMGRFFNVDPLSEKYPTWSTYAFSGNRVVDARELEGLEPYILFKTEENAAKNFGQQYNGKSIIQGKEYAANIYLKKAADGKMYYYYDTPNKGDAASSRASLTWFSEGKPTSVIHSHGKSTVGDKIQYDDNNFSETDKNKGERTGKKEYLTTPDGSLKVYDPVKNSPNENGRVISTDLPSDPKDPNRQNKINPVENPDPVKTKPIEPKKVEIKTGGEVEYHHGRIM
ncbi:DUF4329 domain-containing protein [Chryseobacterium kwangjuense]|uniref:DUF4329 domain-containing protein n=1 Tax=Chryseobacterium kwangjuense TaxID=267125 RepID=A0A135W8G4_9FLAO|nr:DUF4329 domain-containing protein [Chryseobacterium kwangjuense]KXH81147.1 hypothetical protein AU378_15605 [Chryseobacterium kwangjuense]